MTLTTTDALRLLHSHVEEINPDTLKMMEGYARFTGISTPILELFGRIYKAVSTELRPELSTNFSRVNRDFRNLVSRRIKTLEGEEKTRLGVWARKNESAACVDAKNHVQEVLFLAEAVLRTKFADGKDLASRAARDLATKDYPKLLDHDVQEQVSTIFKKELPRLAELMQDEEKWADAADLVEELKQKLLET